MAKRFTENGRPQAGKRTFWLRIDPSLSPFRRVRKGQNDVPLFLGAGDGSPFAKLIPKIAEGLRANGCTQVETGLIPGSVHYLVEDQPDRVADLVERYASRHLE